MIFASRPGGVPLAANWLQVGVPPIPLAFVRIQTSAGSYTHVWKIRQSLPPPGRIPIATINRFDCASYAVLAPSIPGNEPTGSSCVQDGDPVVPSALLKIQTSLRTKVGDVADSPPTRIARFVALSYTMEALALAGGESGAFAAIA